MSGTNTRRCLKWERWLLPAVLPVTFLCLCLRSWFLSEHFAVITFGYVTILCSLAAVGQYRSRRSRERKGMEPNTGRTGDAAYGPMAWLDDPRPGWVWKVYAVGAGLVGAAALVNRHPTTWSWASTGAIAVFLGLLAFGFYRGG